MSLHHEYSPSKAGQIEDCPATIEYSRRARAISLNLDDMEAAAEGSLGHEYLDPARPLDSLPADMVWVVEKARAYEAALFQGAESIVREFRLTLYDHEGHEITYGTADAAALYPELVRVIDCKMGFGSLVNRHVSLQAAIYGAAAMQLWRLPKAEVSVYQPRTGLEIRGVINDAREVADRVQAIIQRAITNPLEAHPSEEACRYCQGKAVCPAYSQMFTELLPAKEDIPKALVDPKRLAQLHRICALARAMEPQVSAKLKELLESGVEVEGYELATRRERVLPSVEKVYGQLQDVLTQDEMLSNTKVNVSNLEESFARKFQAMQAGNGATIKAGREEFKRRLADVTVIEEKKVLKRKGE